MNETTKKCSCCGQVKPLSDFPVNKGCKDGHTGQCKKCKVKLARERRNLNRQSCPPPKSRPPAA